MSTLGTRNGRTLATPGAGSKAKVGHVGRQAPGVVPITGVGTSRWSRPSPARAASIAAAACSPSAIPRVLPGRSGIAASDAS